MELLKVQVIWSLEYPEGVFKAREDSAYYFIIDKQPFTAKRIFELFEGPVKKGHNTGFMIE